jgi:hypothetical protein
MKAIFSRVSTWLGLGGWFTLTTLYVENKAFHDYVFKIFSKFPHFMQEFVVGLIVPIAIAMMQYRKAKVAAGAQNDNVIQ